MTEQMIINIVREAFWYVLMTVGPILIASLIVGLTISIFQAATSIQEQTLTFVPKLIITFVLIVVLLPFFITNLKAFTIQLFQMIPTLNAFVG
ncbi:MAG: flagellar biosynthesis protein FliQ [Bacteroidetes bacterium]|nr:flagellar biosynthesis protein FliQ [Bacteroidota bacterium]